MVLTGAALVATLTLSSIAATLVALFAAAWLNSENRRRHRAAKASSGTDDAVSFLFDRTTLVDATSPAEKLLAAAPTDSDDWSRFLAVLTPQFPDLVDLLDQPKFDGIQKLVSQDTTTQLVIKHHDGMCRVSVLDKDVDAPTLDIDSQSYAALERELDTLRNNTEVGPCLSWRQDSAGRIIWVNRTYVKAIERLKGKEAAKRWPTPALFDPKAVADSVEHDHPLRVALRAQNGENWYDVHASLVGQEIVCTAVDVDEVIESKRQLQAFTQTLTKTFADLAVGLAIFDKSRKLALFNPALAELTELPFGFLAGNPTLFRFLDRMRDLGRVPEPRNYSEWRGRMADLESNAADGQVSETWTLANGQTLRVTGRPHPDGALAFIFEDISAEITLTRRFRAELAAGRSVIDHFEEAIAVFSTSGALTMANTAYCDLWGQDPMSGVAQVDIAEAVGYWQENSLPSASWEKAATYVFGASDRVPWSSEITLRDGRRVTCRFVPMSGGSTLVGFTPNVARSGQVQFRRRAS